jgi:hypothetical protein
MRRRSTCWDSEILGWLSRHRARRVRKLDVWDVNWQHAAYSFGEPIEAERLTDPRGRIVRSVHRWFAKTQSRAADRRVRVIHRALIPFGW